MPLSMVVDTNVVSEMMRPHPDKRVLVWFDGVTASELFLAATSLAELRTGLSLMPVGRRQQYFALSLNQILERYFAGRVLSFDRTAAERFAEIVSRAQGQGRRIEIADGQIAAIAAVHGFAVATRDTSPFTAAGVPVIDPWAAN